MDYDKLSDDELRELALKKIQKPAPVPDFEKMSDNELRKLAFEKMSKQRQHQGPKESTQGQAAVEGFGSGISLGYLPQIQAKLEPLTDRLFGLFDENSEHVDKAPISQLYLNDENYIKARDKNIARQKQLKEDNPWTYGASEVGGGVVAGIAASPLQGANAASKVKQAATIGGAYGMLANPGDVEGVVDELQLTPRLRNAVVGAITGAGVQKGLDVIGKYSKALAGKLSDKIQERSLKRAAEAEARMNGNSGSSLNVKIASKPRTGKEVFKAIKESADEIRPSEYTDDLNKQYAKLGLEELSPVQMQKKVMGEPTPAQYAESMLKAGNQKMYDKQVKQVESLDRALEQFKDLGSVNKETFGANINKSLDEALDAAGSTIGDFKNSIKNNPVDKRDMFNSLKNYKIEASKLEPADTNKARNYVNRLFNSKNAKDVDNTLSLLGAEIRKAKVQAGGETPYTRMLGNIKKGGEDYIEQMIPHGKPREAYKQYAAVKNMYRDTLKGALKTGGDDKVLSNITKTAENFKQFKQVSETLKRPELVTEVKENYLSEIFNNKNWKSQWEKARKTQVYNEIVPKEIDKRISLIAQYKDQMTSTMTSSTNPSKSGILNTVREFAQNPLKKVTEMVIGDERKMSKAMIEYNKLLNSKRPDDKLLKKMSSAFELIPGVTDLSTKNPIAFQTMIYKSMVNSPEHVKLSSNERKIKGKEKWQARGLSNISNHATSFDINDQDTIEKLMFTKKGEEYLEKASGLKKDSKAMKSLLKEIETYLKDENK